MAKITVTPRDGGDRPPLGAPLGPAVIKRKEDEQDHAQRRDPDRCELHDARRLDDAQNLEQKKEVPLRPCVVAGRGGVDLRAELVAQDERHHDDHCHDDTSHCRVLGNRVGKEALAVGLQAGVLAKVFLLLALVHVGLPQVGGPRRSGHWQSTYSPAGSGALQAAVAARMEASRCPAVDASFSGRAVVTSATQR